MPPYDRDEMHTLIEVEPVFGAPLPLEADDWPDVFMLMPLKEPFFEVFEDHIRPTVEEFRATSKVAEDFRNARDVLMDIWSSIYHAKVCIADCTGRNPNVFYEVGIAHTLGRPVILITQDWDDLAFDISRRRAIKYGIRPRELDRFKHKLKETLTTELEPLLTETERYVEALLQAQEQYLHDDVSPKTRRAYKNRSDNFVNWMKQQGRGELPVLVERYLEHLARDRGYKSNTIIAHYSAIKGLMGVAARIDYDLAEALFEIENIELPEVDDDDSYQPTQFTREQLHRLLLAPDTNRLKGLRDICILGLVLCVGLSRSDIVSVVWDDFKFESGVTKFRGTKNNWQELPMWLGGYLQKWRAHAFGFEEDPKGSVFVRVRRGGRVSAQERITVSAVSYLVREYVKSADLPSISPRDLRQQIAASEFQDLDRIQ